MFSGAGVQAILQIIVLIILARLLTPEDFGLVAAALIVVNFSDIFSKLGIGPAIVQRPILEERHIRTGFTISLLFGTCLIGIIFLLAPFIAGFFRIEELTSVLYIISLVFPLKGLSMVAESLLQRELRFRWLASIQVLSYAIGFGLVGIILALMEFGVWALVGATIAQTVVKCIILIVVSPHSKLLQIELNAFKELMYFGFGFTAGRISNFAALQGDNLVVGRWLGAEALGLYGRAYQLMAMPVTLFGQVLDKVLFPAMAKVQDEPKRLVTAYRRGVALIALIVLPVSVIMFILAPEIIDLLLGPSWTGVVVPFQILAVGMLFRTSYKMSESLARATGAVYRRAWRQGVYAFLILVGTWIGQHWGLNGVAVGVLVALAFNFSIMAHLSLSIIPMNWKSFFSTHIPALYFSIAVGTVVWFVVLVLRKGDFSSIIVVIVSGLVTLLLLFGLLRYFPSFFLGKDGTWMFQLIIKYIPKKLKFFKYIKSCEQKNEL
ncbi:lipopolysaccharide biosynthesis protein [Anaerobacillus sp. CMMVII]|nr:lipopolysaccharide biosynthesis protein [Anaerobacillus sp. CMMVII]